MGKLPWRVCSVSLLTVFCLWFASVSGAPNFKSAMKSVGRTISNEIQSVKQPIDRAFFSLANSQCANVKKLVGVFYKEVTGAVEPDLNRLNLQFISPTVEITFNLSSAAETIPTFRNYNSSKNLILYMHGFTESTHGFMGFNFKAVSEAFLKQGEYNILGLDSSSLISWFYLRSSTYVRFIGERLGEMLAALFHKGQHPKSIHLIGFSLGSHISGFAGKTFHNLTGSKLGRITGLDPAGPCFSNIPSELRLKKTDADFVDVIHTDDGVMGLDEAIGHVDFYPNGGSHQPGCALQVCSHFRAVQYYAESIGKPDAFIGRQCQDYNQFREGKWSDDTSVMGYHCPASARGKYFLQTGEKEPYGREEGGLRFINNEGIVRNVGHAAASIFRGILRKV